ncbi:MAG: restriction endonuclease subunit S [Akkermansiaceae bacterium]|nr:restriction endonuclease subunit S [Akkermansiaceae bacterium]
MRAYPAYKDSGIPWFGKVPKHWHIIKLRNLLHKFSQKGNPDLPLLSVVRERGVILRDVTSKEENHNFIPDDLSKYKVLLDGQFVINKMKAWQGSYAVSTLIGIVSPAYFIYNIDYSNLLPRFFNVAIRSKAYINFFNQSSDGVRIGQWDLDETKMRNIPFLVPTKEEQQAIVAYLDKKCAEIEELISRRQAIIERLKELKQSIIAEAVTKGLNPKAPMKESGVSWLGSIPEHWRIKRFGTVFTERKTKVSDKVYPPISVTKLGILPQLETAVKTDNGDNRKLVLKGDFVINSRSDRKGSSGISPYNGSVSLISLVLIPEAEWNHSYIHHLLRSVPFQEEFYQKGHGIVADLWTTRYTDIASTYLPEPPYEEQQAIVSYLDKKCAAIDELVSRHEQIIEKLKELKTATIADVVTGKVDVRESI